MGGALYRETISEERFDNVKSRTTVAATRPLKYQKRRVQVVVPDFTGIASRIKFALKLLPTAREKLKRVP